MTNYRYTIVSLFFLAFTLISCGASGGALRPPSVEKEIKYIEKFTGIDNIVPTPTAPTENDTVSEVSSSVVSTETQMTITVQGGLKSGESAVVDIDGKYITLTQGTITATITLSSEDSKKGSIDANAKVTATYIESENIVYKYKADTTTPPTPPTTDNPTADYIKAMGNYLGIGNNITTASVFINALGNPSVTRWLAISGDEKTGSLDGKQYTLYFFDSQYTHYPWISVVGNTDKVNLFTFNKVDGPVNERLITEIVFVNPTTGYTKIIKPFATVPNNSPNKWINKGTGMTDSEKSKLGNSYKMFIHVTALGLPGGKLGDGKRILNAERI